jgi:5-keto 4-deoxyuronate isomerase
MVAVGITACGSKEPNPQDQVHTKITRFDVGGFGAVMIADFTIKNNTSLPVKDVTVICNGKSETGTKIDRNERVIYKVINPNQTITVNDFNMGFISTNVTTTSCYTSKFVSL